MINSIDHPHKWWEMYTMPCNARCEHHSVARRGPVSLRFANLMELVRLHLISSDQSDQTSIRYSFTTRDDLLELADDSGTSAGVRRTLSRDTHGCGHQRRTQSIAIERDIISLSKSLVTDSRDTNCNQEFTSQTMSKPAQSSGPTPVISN